MDRYGCPACGAPADAVAESSSTGHGRLAGFATVHAALSPERPTPFVVGNVKLDDGPFLTVVLDVAKEAELEIGQPMVARPVERTVGQEGGSESRIVEWLFAPAREAGR